MDENNPQVKALTLIPPSMLEELKTDPQAMQPQWRIMMAIQADKAHRESIHNPNITIGQRLQVIDMLAKLSDAYPKANPQQAAGSGAPTFSVQINFTKPVGKQLTNVVVEDVVAKAPVILPVPLEPSNDSAKEG